MPMGSKVRLALVQFAPAACARDENLRVCRELVGGKKADIFIFPHLFSTAAGPAEYSRMAEKPDGPTSTFLRKLAKDKKAYVLGSYLARRPSAPNKPYARYVALDPSGRTIGVYDCIHRCSILGEADTLSAGKKLPFFDLLTFRSGVIGSYDLRFPELAREFGLSNGFLLFVCGAYKKNERLAWDSLLAARAVENQMFAIGCNFGATPKQQAETETDIFCGGSAVFAPDGRKLHQAGGGEQVLILDIDPFEVEWSRVHLQYITDARPNVRRSHVLESPLDKD